MNPTKKWLLYSAYLIATTTFFIYYLFPSETVEKYIATNLRQVNPDFSVSIDYIRPSFPPGVQLFKVNLYYSGNPLFETPKIKITPALLSLFQPKKTIRFKTRTYGGEISGEAEIDGDESARRATIHLNLSEVQINDIPAIRKRTDFNLSGRLGGTIEYRNQKNLSEFVSAKLNISACKLKIFTLPIKLDDLTFSHIESELNMNKQQIRIMQCTAKGQDLDGTLSGTILLNQQVGDSGLNLNGKITLHPLFLANLTKKLPVNSILKNRSGNSQVPFRVRGTIQKPVFELR